MNAVSRELAESHTRPAESHTQRVEFAAQTAEFDTGDSGVPSGGFA